MDMQTRLQYLWQRYDQCLATDEELDELASLLQNPGATAEHVSLFIASLETTERKTDMDKERWDVVLQNILLDKDNRQVAKGRYARLYRFSAAAAIVVAISIGLWYLLLPEKQQVVSETGLVTSKQAKDILPGGNKAVLQLADGSRLMLDSAGSGAIARQGNTQIIKSAAGVIEYNAMSGKSAEVLYNMIFTPRGGQYQVQLPDGSRVWLNAASSLKYPTSFNGNRRMVTLTGEGYFEVAHDKSRPFIVQINDMQVEVLGTKFNVMAYADEAAIQSTLLEGSVKVSTANATRLLQPGQQSQLDKAGQLKIKTGIDVQQTVAWKNHLFIFQDTELPAILRQLARWYDVDISYPPEMANKHYTGIISRDLPISNVFAMFQQIDDIHYQVEEKKIIIVP